MSSAVLSHTRFDGDEIKIVGEILDHSIAIEYVLGVMLSKNHGVIDDKEDIDAVGHSVVHGGETFSDSVFITDEVMKVLQDNIELAPLHNPPNIKGIQAVKSAMQKLRNARFLILLFMLKCLLKHIFTEFLMNCIKNIKSEDTVFTELPIFGFLIKLRKFSVKISMN